MGSPSSTNFSGVVLAAGRSTRMGRDKALLEVAGTPLWRRQRGVLAAAGASAVYVSARPEQAWAREAADFAAVLHDGLPDCGPIVGITAALERAGDPWLAVLAIDLPAMAPDWFVKLAAERTAGTGVVGRRDGFFEPLAAIYPREFMWLAWEAIGRGDYGMQRVLQTAVEKGVMRVREISAAEAPWFENWNEPAEVGDPLGDNVEQRNA